MKKAKSRESTERCDGLSDGALNEYEHREKGRREGAGEEDEDTEKVGGGGGGSGFPAKFVPRLPNMKKQTDMNHSENCSIKGPSTVSQSVSRANVTLPLCSHSPQRISSDRPEGKNSS